MGLIMADDGSVSGNAAGGKRDGLYGAWFDASIDAGAEVLKNAPDETFSYAVKSTTITPAEGPTRDLFNAMGSEHYFPSMSTALSILEDEAFADGRAITRQKTKDGATVVTFGPVPQA
jgi:hypothetical protein